MFLQKWNIMPISFSITFYNINTHALQFTCRNMVILFKFKGFKSLHFTLLTYTLVHVTSYFTKKFVLYNTIFMR